MVYYVFAEGRKTPSGRVKASESTSLDRVIARARKIINSPNLQILTTSKRPKEEQKRVDPFRDGFYVPGGAIIPGWNPQQELVIV